MKSLFLFFILIFFSFLTGISRADEAPSTPSIASFQQTYLDKSCTSSEGLSSKYSRPLTSKVVECIDGTLSSLFLNTNKRTGMTLFQEFQSVVKSTVILALILYIIVNGYLIATGQVMRESPKREIMMFFIKFLLVFYFAIGDAWKDFFFQALRSISSTLSSILIEAGAITNLDGCTFVGKDMEPYPIGKGYLAIFDSLDCKFANYMGWFNNLTYPSILPIAFIVFFIPGMGPIVSGLLFVFIMQLLLLASRVVLLYLASVSILTLLIYSSPILVPMSLFESTKNIFSAWLNKIIGLVVYPILIFGFLGIVLTISDRFYYGPNPDDNNLFMKTTNSVENGRSVFGAEVNPKCYPDSRVTIPLVCLARQFSDNFWELPLLSSNIRFITLYLPGTTIITKMPSIISAVFLGCICNFLLGICFEKLQGLAEQIAGAGPGGMASKLPSMYDATKGAYQYGQSGAQSLQDRFRLRQETPQSTHAGISVGTGQQQSGGALSVGVGGTPGGTPTPPTGGTPGGTPTPPTSPPTT